DAQAPPPRGAHRRRLHEVPHRPARHDVLPPARDAPRQGSVARGAWPLGSLVSGTSPLRLVDQSLDLSTITTALGRHRSDRVVHVQKTEAAPYQAVSKDPDRADRLLHRDVT